MNHEWCEKKKRRIQRQLSDNISVFIDETIDLDKQTENQSNHEKKEIMINALW